MTENPYYKTRVRKKGQITVPSEVREILKIEEGDDLAFYINENGQVTIDRLRVIPPDQAWFWTERWQQFEREAQVDIDAERVQEFDDVEDLIDWLDEAEDAKD